MTANPKVCAAARAQISYQAIVEVCIWVEARTWNIFVIEVNMRSKRPRVKANASKCAACVQTCYYAMVEVRICRSAHIQYLWNWYTHLRYANLLMCMQLSGASKASTTTHTVGRQRQRQGGLQLRRGRERKPRPCLITVSLCSEYSESCAVVQSGKCLARLCI